MRSYHSTRNLFTALLVAIVAAVCVNAQEVEYIETSESPVQIYHSNIGITGFDVAKGLSGNVWPRGSDNQFIFGLGLWLGGVVPTSDGIGRHLVARTYNPMTGTGWFRPSTGLEVDDDVVAQSLRYNSTFNDADLSAYDRPAQRAEEGYPLGLEVQQTLTVFTDGQLQDVAISEIHSAQHASYARHPPICAGYRFGSRHRQE